MKSFCLAQEPNKFSFRPNQCQPLLGYGGIMKIFPNSHIVYNRINPCTALIASDVIMFIHLQSCVSSQESLPVPCILWLKQQQHLVSGWLLRAERSLPLLVRSFACLLIQLAASSTLPSRLHVCSASPPPRVKYQSAFNFIVRPIQFTRG